MMHGRFLLLVMACAIGLSACGEKKPGAAPAPQARVLAPADILVVHRAPVADTLPLTGTLSALSASVVSAQTDGIVKSVLVREGEHVKKGQLLASIDEELLRQAVLEQTAQMDNARARLALARVKLEKQRELFRQGFISRIALDEFESDFKVREGEVAVQAAALARSRRSLADARVVSPIAGVVYERKINPGDTASRNTRLFAVADLSVLELTATMPARQSTRIRIGMTARFAVEGSREEAVATVVRINPVAASETRAIDIYLRVDNRDGRLRAGQFVKGALELARADDGVALPQSALHDAAKAPWVMTVVKGRLIRQPVSVLLTADVARQVSVRGLDEGTVILQGSLLGLKPGDAVALPVKKG